MKRIFCDVDDTLILYESSKKINPYGFWKNDSYTRNSNLINAIKEYRKTFPDVLIVIWSGGGEDYAREAANHLFPNNDFTHMLKDWDHFPLVREYDIVIDDAEFSLGDHFFRVFSPSEGAEAIRDEIKTKTH